MVLSTIDSITRGKHKKVVIIVNDFGSIGIDGKVMEKYGLQVTEMPSGCICCTLGSDLLRTLSVVAEAFEPDLVVIEPTGIADPEAIHSTLELYTGPPIDKKTIVVIVDAVRFPVILKALEKPLMNQLKAANLIVINKTDQVDSAAVAAVETTIRDLCIKARIIPASATQGTNLDQVVAAMVG